MHQNCAVIILHTFVYAVVEFVSPLETAVRLIFRLLAATWLVVFVAPASGAEIRRASGFSELRYVGFAHVILEGKLERGDYDKLLRLIDEDCRDYSCTDGIYLASPGGDLIEAMKIGRLVRKLRLETHVPSDVPAIPSGLLPEYRQKIEAHPKGSREQSEGLQSHP
jgi:hypothetical protein